MFKLHCLNDPLVMARPVKRKTRKLIRRRMLMQHFFHPRTLVPSLIDRVINRVKTRHVTLQGFLSLLRIQTSEEENCGVHVEPAPPFFQKKLSPPSSSFSSCCCHTSLRCTGSVQFPFSCCSVGYKSKLKNKSTNKTKFK